MSNASLSYAGVWIVNSRAKFTIHSRVMFTSPWASR